MCWRSLLLGGLLEHPLDDLGLLDEEGSGDPGNKKKDPNQTFMSD